jgi:hypothetical protein
MLICCAFIKVQWVSKVLCRYIAQLLRCNRYQRYYVDISRDCQGAIGIKKVFVLIYCVLSGKGV